MTIQLKTLLAPLFCAAALSSCVGPEGMPMYGAPPMGRPMGPPPQGPVMYSQPSPALPLAVFAAGALSANGNNRGYRGSSPFNSAMNSGNRALYDFTRAQRNIQQFGQNQQRVQRAMEANELRRLRNLEAIQKQQRRMQQQNMYY